MKIYAFCALGMDFLQREVNKRREVNGYTSEKVWRQLGCDT